ncbi:hypothetical protein OUZ56_016620 [Daphnia magna]|uniref:HTH psq-type domain-containing protein n=1 Tax=Daphnia magna TaxID=35525 RepID=A0ABR0AR28_9CRUS|nr:hypothetical protein OUZ56_016620 [Daphnia magna]
MGSSEMAYTSEDLENAVATYVSGDGSYRSIASMFGIPKTTLSRKFHELSRESKKEICCWKKLLEKLP